MCIKIQKPHFVIGLLLALLLAFYFYSEAITAVNINPTMNTGLFGFGVSGKLWTPNGNVEIEIYDYPGGAIIVGPLTLTADGDGRFNSPPVTFFVPGMFVRITDLETSTIKELTVQNIEVTTVNFDTNLVVGTAPANAQVEIEISGGNEAVRLVIADGSGHWEADFTGLIDIEPQHAVYVRYWDEDGDWVDLGPNPLYLHMQGGYDWDWMEFLFYSPVNTITYQIFDDQGVLLTSGDIQTDATGRSYINRDDHGIEFQPGYQIVSLDHRRNVSDTITLQNISTSAVDYDLNYVEGAAPPNIDLKIVVGIDVGGVGSIHHFDIHSDSNGHWSCYLMDEFGYDLTLDTWVYAELSDENSNTTLAALDEDNDEAINGSDNAMTEFNPDQSDLDADGVGDVADPCPNNLENSCNVNRSGAISINQLGGELITPIGDTNVTVPAGSLSADTSISITDTGEGYLWPTQTKSSSSTSPDIWAVFSNFIGPSTMTVTVPITITLTWNDFNNDSVLDILGIAEKDLRVLYNDTALTGYCEFDPGCNPENNQFVFTTTNLGDFALVGEKTVYWLYLPMAIR